MTRKKIAIERDKLWYLENFNFFDSMSQEEMESLSDMVVDNEVKKKQPIYLAGDPSENLYFLKDGLINIDTMNGHKLNFC